MLTMQFETIPAMYEAGVAEIYDYSHLGPDPLRSIVHDLGLKTTRMQSRTVVLGEDILRGRQGFLRRFGSESDSALGEFYKKCGSLCSPSDYYEGYAPFDMNHQWAHRTFREVLDEIPDHNARRYIETAVRCDTATEPHLTSGLNGLKNVLMDDPSYLKLYSIDAGIEEIPKRLAARLRRTAIELGTQLVAVHRAPDGRFRLQFRKNGSEQSRDFDQVILALPHNWLSQVKFEDPSLELVLRKHVAAYDHGGHYLRITIAFDKPFWFDKIKGAYFTSDAFGGCCIYDEGARRPIKPYGVLGWLLAGADALALCGLSDCDLIAKVLDFLPRSLAHGTSLFRRGTFIAGRLQ